MAKQYATWQIAAAYIGTVVGAGFASGQEVLQFFGYFGLRGIFGLILATALFIFFGYTVLRLGHQLAAESHLAVMHRAGGPWIGRAVDIITTFFLFGALAVMAAGAGAIFSQEFRLPGFWGSSLLVIITLITVLAGINKVIGSISLVAPVLITSVMGISLVAVTRNLPAFIANLSWSDMTRAAVPFWPLAALLYASYNLVLAIAVLAPLGALGRPEHLLPGAALGGLGLGMGAMAITLALITTAPAVTALEVPMLHIAGSFTPLLRTFYSVVLLAEIYTTAVSSLYGFTARMVRLGGRNSFRWLAIGASTVALVASQFGFSRLVATLFPLVGYAGLLLLGALAYYALREALPALRLGPVKRLAPAPARKPVEGEAINRSRRDGQEQQ
ncbi:Uncharacterized [Moorella glycerini]|uniref:Membrane protein YkvI n=1 Tax=Neomoorella stamsii TaxID=1266720 RepID=A0A9X7P7F9_9FIRM|nr:MULTISPECIES: hypothetical protein [Moorella]PRR77359.1 hypothetical protein MOST_02740 [Moorella stamsii]CEP65992.1 Uncharacterized [Moorella glycerini]